jgi:hypothetical protein
MENVASCNCLKNGHCRKSGNEPKLGCVGGRRRAKGSKTEAREKDLKIWQSPEVQARGRSHHSSLGYPLWYHVGRSWLYDYRLKLYSSPPPTDKNKLVPGYAGTFMGCAVRSMHKLVGTRPSDPRVKRKHRTNQKQRKPTQDVRAPPQVSLTMQFRQTSQRSSPSLAVRAGHAPLLRGALPRARPRAQVAAATGCAVLAHATATRVLARHSATMRMAL